MEDRFHLNSNPKEYEKLNAFMSYNRIEIAEINNDMILLKHVMDKNSVNLNGTAHGGLLMTMTDVAAGTLVRKNGDNCATSSFTINFLRPSKGGTIYCRGEYIKRGKRINVMHTWCYDENDTLLCDAVVNMCFIE